MTIIRIPDRFNAKKVWLIKRYPSGNYYINQEICGKTFYDGFVRVTKKFIADILGGLEQLCQRSKKDMAGGENYEP